jgi:ABC-2 type transport system ATP-binding protein
VLNTSPVVVDIQALTKSFGLVKALDSVSLSVYQGEVLGLLGPNGAGKTTLISSLAGLTRADSGHVSVMGFDVQKHYASARRNLGIVPQELVFDPFFTVRESLRLQSGYFGLSGNDEWIEHLLARLDLSAKGDVNMRNLSGGMKRRVLVAQALVHRPPVIVLDEPTAGVDVELRQSLWEFMKELNQQGHTIVLTTHYLEEAQSLCDRIAMLKAGKIIALDSTENLLLNQSSLTMRFRTQSPIPVLITATASGESYWFDVQIQSYGEVERVLSTLREGGCEVLEMEIVRPDLESAFVRIMRNGGVAQ